MKIKFTTVLMAMMFFLTVSLFADNETSKKAKELPDCGCGDDFEDNSNSFYYDFNPWWIGPAESLPDHKLK